MKRYTVDASVIIKWVVGSEQEPDHDKAMILLEGWAQGEVNINSPSLWSYEVGNFLGRQLPDSASEKMKFLTDLRMPEVPMSEGMYRECFRWMNEKRVTFYDAAYLASAIMTQSTLITVDVKFIKKIGNHESICLLSELGS